MIGTLITVVASPAVCAVETVTCLGEYDGAHIAIGACPVIGADVTIGAGPVGGAFRTIVRRREIGWTDVTVITGPVACAFRTVALGGEIVRALVAT